MYSKISYLQNLSQTVQGKLKTLRLLTRSHQKTLLKNSIENTYFEDEVLKDKVLCSFCSTTKNITKEHVIPRWLFEKNTGINGLGQTYNKATIPACKICNSEILSSLEIYILQLFNTAHSNISELSVDEKENIIRWLEIIDYKFHLLQANSDVKTPLYRSLTRITIKNKLKHINSLVLFKTTREGFHFFQTMDEYIFMELPIQQFALFYFYSKTFKTPQEAQKEATKIIESNYKNNTKKQ